MKWTLLHKYLTGEHTPEEKEQTERWIQSDEQNRKMVDGLLKIWSVEPEDHIQVSTHQGWDALRGRFSENKKKDSKGAKSPSSQNIRTESARRKEYSYKAAVPIAAAAIAAAAVLVYMFLPGLDLLYESDAPKARVQEISTELGQRTSFLLSDNTLVHLNAGSRVTIPPTFGDSVRSIRLTGEAYFDVTHDQGIPFIVHSGGSATRVLGTKFCIKAYTGEEQVQVVVEEGAVELRSSNQASEAAVRHLTKKQVGRLGPDGNITMENIEKIAGYLGWKDGRLVFESTSFEEVVPRLERWYRIEIEADPSFDKQKVTASFSDEPMMEVMNILAASLDADLKKNDRTMIFNSK